MNDKFRYTILGCGSSPGTPRINGDWGACDPLEPKNRRLRCSLLVERIGVDGVTRIVIDTGPDFREQMLSAKVTALDAVLYTHSHADHVHGVDDLRGFALAQKMRVPIYADLYTLDRLYEGFGYCLKQPEGSMYPPILEPHTIEAGKPLVIAGEGGEIYILPILQKHGSITSLGFRFSSDDKFSSGGLCYSSDVSDIPNDSVSMFEKADCWILDALQYKPHISHFSVSQSLEWIEKLGPKSAILTHMHIPLDYQTLKSELPEHVQPAYDGMVLEYSF